LIDIFFYPFLLVLVLIFIHSYFGLEIIKRNIIFTDLAIGQIASIGAALSIVFFEGVFSYLLSLLFASFGGVLIYLFEKYSLKPEALIGLLYSFSYSLLFVILQNHPSGFEEFKRLIVSDILFVDSLDVFYSYIFYFLVAIFIFVLKRFNKLNNILFFLLFSITITKSIYLVGVFVVFVLLVAPAFVSTLFFKDGNFKLAFIYGVIITTMAVVSSYYLDISTGFTICLFQSLFGILIFFVWYRFYRI